MFANIYSKSKIIWSSYNPILHVKKLHELVFLRIYVHYELDLHYWLKIILEPSYALTLAVNSVVLSLAAYNTHYLSYSQHDPTINKLNFNCTISSKSFEAFWRKKTHFWKIYLKFFKLLYFTAGSCFLFYFIITLRNYVTLLLLITVSVRPSCGNTWFLGCNER